MNTTRGAFPQQASRIVAVCLLACALAGLAGCGYQLGADAPSIFSSGNGTAKKLPTLKVKSIEHPTLYPWITYELRNLLRNEVTARHLVEWVDSGRADYEITLKVSGFYYNTHVTTRDDIAQLYAADMTVEGLVYDGATNRLVWRSGQVGYSQAYEQIEEKTVAVELAANIIRQLVDRMRQSF